VDNRSTVRSIGALAAKRITKNGDRAGDYGLSNVLTRKEEETKRLSPFTAAEGESPISKVEFSYPLRSTLRPRPLQSLEQHCRLDKGEPEGDERQCQVYDRDRRRKR
jgi:hypothetical protein